MYQNGQIKSFCIHSDSVAHTQALATRCAALLKGGEIILLRGPIGAGKTIFVKGIAHALGLKSSPTSASFSLMKRYQNKKYTVFHIDLFRLSEGEVFNLGFEEMLENEQAIILAEWPDPIVRMFPKDRLEIDFKLEQGNRRQITFTANGPVSHTLAEQLCK